jgi:hypothetical protein
MSADIVDRQNVRVIQRGRGAGFLFEASEAIGVGGQPRGENLDGDITPEAWITGLIHLAHAPGTDRGQDFVRADTGAGGKGLRRSGSD